ncbi:MAG: hypothetical protein ABGW95_05080 [Candidatus Poseidoniia archaeon]
MTWSRGLKALLGVLDVDDDEALEQGQERADSDGSEIVSEERVSLAAVDMSVPPSARVVAEWLEIGETYGAEGLKRFLKGLEPEPPPPPPPPIPEPPAPQQLALDL